MVLHSAPGTRPEQPRVVLVLGMHRSGTSAVTRGLGLLGVELGNNFLPAAPDNEKGFWEDRDFYGLNVELLRRLGFDWDTPELLGASALDGQDTGAFRLRAAALIREKIGSRSALGIKDPRIARLLPFWKGVADHLGFVTAFVIVLRHPLSVARSLRTRNGFDERKSHYLWLQHVVPSLLGTEGSPRVVVDYDRLMDDPPRQLARIAGALDLPFDPAGSDVREYVREFLEERLRHTRFHPEDLALDPAVPKAVIEIYGLMEALSRDELPIDSTQVGQRFREWARELHELSPALAYMTKCEKQLSDRNRRIELVGQFLNQRESEIRELQQQLLERDERIAELERIAAADRDSLMTGLNQIVTDLRAQMATLIHVASERDVHIDSLVRSMEELTAETARRGVAAFKLECVLEELHTQAGGSGSSLGAPLQR